MSTRELIIRRAVSTGTMWLLPLGTGYRPAIIDHVAASLLVVYSPSFIVCRLRRGCPTSLCSSRFVAGARKGLHACRSVRLALVVVKIGALYTLQAYRSPSAGHHEVLGLLVCECDKANVNVSIRVQSMALDGYGRTHSRAASDTGILLRFRSSCRRWLSSVSRLSFSSAIDCFLLLPLSLLRIS